MERFSSVLLLTSSQVADLLDVHVSTVKRWTNEGDLKSSTTAGGHRRIHLDDALEVARRRGISTYLDAFAPFQGHVWRAVREAEDASDFRRVQSLAMGWLLREHAQRVGDLFVQLGTRGRIPFDQLFDRGIREFLVRVSEAVREGRLRAGGERQVAQVLLEALFRIHLGVPLSPHPPRPRSGPLAVVGSLSGNSHDLGVMGIRLLLEREGFHVYYLGPDVPPEDLALAQRAQGADLVCIACGPHTDRGAVVDSIRTMAASYDARTPFALVVSLPGASLDLTGVPNPFAALTLPDSSEALAAWIRRRMTRDQPGRRASA